MENEIWAYKELWDTKVGEWELPIEGLAVAKLFSLTEESHGCVFG